MTTRRCTRRWLAALVAVGVLGAGACSGRDATAVPGTASQPVLSSTTSVTVPDGGASGAATTTAAPGLERSVREVLAELVIDDAPAADHPYRRADWPTWSDIDDDGCDARQQALIEQSASAAQVDPAGCTVVAGDWVSIYDGVSTESPADLDIDHVVPLENAHESGGWRWTADQRRQFANDQMNLRAVSASSNRSKGSRTPQEWRPPRTEAWCQTATTWVAVKVRFGLTATTEERDALGQMLDTCS